MYSRYIADPKELSIVHNRPMTSLQNNRLGTNNRLCTHWEPRILKMDRPMQQDMSPHIAIGSYFASATLRIGKLQTQNQLVMSLFFVQIMDGVKNNWKPIR